MNRAKRKRLEGKGWKVGDAEDFLSLSPEEAAHVELKLSFSQYLKARRQEKRLTQAQLAKLIKSSQSRVAKMEAGDPTVSLDLLVRRPRRNETSTLSLRRCNEALLLTIRLAAPDPSGICTYLAVCSAEIAFRD
jgi:hypothetical protein